MRAFLFTAAFLAASVASAQGPVFKITKPGYYQLLNGRLAPVQVIDVDDPTPPLPPDDPTPPPQPATDLAKAVTAAVQKIPVSDKRHAAAMKLTATYQMLGGQVKDGKIHPASAVKAAEMICPIALGADGKAWAGVFSVVNAAVGKAGTPAATAAVFDEAATAVLAMVPAAGDGEDAMAAAAERYGFDWTTFMAFLMQLLQMLLPLIIS